MKNTGTIVTLALILTACNTKRSYNMENQNVPPAAITEAKEADGDKNAIRQLMETLFSSTDLRDWNSVTGTMTDSVYVDYSALGGASGFKTPEEIVTDWQQLLPGFDRTLHQPHNFSVWVAGDRATATLDAIATHYLETDQGENHWTVFAGYDTEYIKVNGAWKLARIDLSLYDQVGNRSLPEKAMEVVKNGLVKPLRTTTKTKETVEHFFNALENNNLNDLLALLDRKIVQQMPLAPSGFPKTLNGIDAMKKQYMGVMDYTSVIRVSIFLRIIRIQYW